MWGRLQADGISKTNSRVWSWRYPVPQADTSPVHDVYRIRMMYTYREHWDSTGMLNSTKVRRARRQEASSKARREGAACGVVSGQNKTRRRRKSEEKG